MEGPVADQMHDNETEISDFTDVASFYHSAFFASNATTKGRVEKRRTEGKKGKNILQNVVLRPREAGGGGGSGIFSSDNSHFWGNRANPLNHRSPSKWNGYFVF